MIISLSDLIKEKESKNQEEKYIGSLMKDNKLDLLEFGLIKKDQESLSLDHWEIYRPKE